MIHDILSYHCDSVTVSYGPDIILDSLSIIFQKNLFYGIFAPSGRGKSTLLSSIAGFTALKTGTVYALYKNLEKVSCSSCAKIAYITQQNTLMPELTVRDNCKIIFYTSMVSSCKSFEDEISYWSSLLEINALLDRLPGNLSGGQIQLAHMLRACVSGSDLFLIDEITAHLDDINTHKIMNLCSFLKEQRHATIIFATHDNRVIPFCDKILTL